MKSQQAQGGDFFGLYQVANVAAGVILAGGAGAFWVQAPFVF